MSEAEKRAKQMAEMGIDESDISDVPLISSKTKQAVEKKESVQVNGKQPPGKNPAAKADSSNTVDKKKEDVGFDPITPELLRTDKQYVKLVKKQQSEVDVMKKRQSKEKAAMQKNHAMVVDKLVEIHEKEKLRLEKSLEKAIKKKG
jgi:phosphatidylinositol phospholipase C beta